MDGMPDNAEQILDNQSDDIPIVIASDGTIHAASSGERGVSMHDAKGDYR